MHYACSFITCRLGLVTCPPAASMRFRSLGVFGLWSSVRRKAAPSLPTDGEETVKRPVDGFQDIRNTSIASVNPSHRLRGCFRNACLWREHTRARLVCMHCSKTMSSKPTACTDVPAQNRSRVACMRCNQFQRSFFVGAKENRDASSGAGWSETERKQEQHSQAIAVPMTGRHKYRQSSRQGNNTGKQTSTDRKAPLSRIRKGEKRRCLGSSRSFLCSTIAWLPVELAASCLASCS